MDCRDFDPQLCIVQLTDFHFGKELQANSCKRADDISRDYKKPTLSLELYCCSLLGTLPIPARKTSIDQRLLFFDYLVEQLANLNTIRKFIYCRVIMTYKTRVSLLSALLTRSMILISRRWRHSMNLPTNTTTDLF